ncbi:hypothetical protein PYCC9005_001447 [Savitreella phatthalungensis]
MREPSTKLKANPCVLEVPVRLANASSSWPSSCQACIRSVRRRLRRSSSTGAASLFIAMREASRRSVVNLVQVALLKALLISERNFAFLLALIVRAKSVSNLSSSPTASSRASSGL